MNTELSLSLFSFSLSLSGLGEDRCGDRRIASVSSAKSESHPQMQGARDAFPWKEEDRKEVLRGPQAE